LLLLLLLLSLPFPLHSLILGKLRRIPPDDQHVCLRDEQTKEQID
jgi:hypothetical protein